MKLIKYAIFGEDHLCWQCPHLNPSISSTSTCFLDLSQIEMVDGHKTEVRLLKNCMERSLGVKLCLFFPLALTLSEPSQICTRKLLHVKSVPDGCCLFCFKCLWKMILLLPCRLRSLDSGET